MKNKMILIFVSLLILLSLLSWIIWSLLFFKFSGININNNETFQANNKNIITEQKVTNITDLQNEITKIVKGLSPWVVSIVIKKDLLVYRNSRFWLFWEPIWSVEQKVWWWTWFFITKDWLIITNKHVISDPEATYSVITYDNKEYDAKVIASDPNNDLAILKIVDNSKQFITLDFVNTVDEINVWQFAIAMWNALAEFQNSVSLWVISWKNRNINDGVNKISWLIQTDAAINPGNSWWPLINLDWKVMWINTAIVQWSEWLWFSISLTKNKIDFILKSIEKYGVIKKPYIWINYIAINDSVKNEYNLNTNNWIYIINQEGSVISGSPADNAWIKPWDIITKINWNEINQNNDLNQFIQSIIPWDKVTLTIIRNWKDKEINIEIISWEA